MAKNSSALYWKYSNLPWVSEYEKHIYDNIILPRKYYFSLIKLQDISVWCYDRLVALHLPLIYSISLKITERFLRNMIQNEFGNITHEK